MDSRTHVRMHGLKWETVPAFSRGIAAAVLRDRIGHGRPNCANAPCRREKPAGTARGEAMNGRHFLESDREAAAAWECLSSSRRERKLMLACMLQC